MTSHLDDVNQHERRVVILYLDGPFGIGKTTAAREFFNRERVYEYCYIEEPWRAWKHWFRGKDYIRDVYDTQVALNNNAMSLEEASRRTTIAQLGIALPYQVMYNLTYDVLHGTPGESGQLNASDLLVLGDRHSIASYVCFPLARRAAGYMTAPDTLTLMAGAPEPRPGTNIVIADVGLDEQIARAKKRNRSGEKINVTFLRVLRNTYILLANTHAFLRHQHLTPKAFTELPPFEESELKTSIRILDLQPEECPPLTRTVFALMKTHDLLDNDNACTPLFFWTAARLAKLLRDTRLFFLRADELSPSEWADALEAIAANADALAATDTHITDLTDRIRAYNADMTI